jgi:cell division inhibitor SepF
MASLNIFGKTQKTTKEEDFDSSYYGQEEDFAPEPQPEEKPAYEKPAAPARSAYTTPKSAPMQMKLVRPSSFVDGQTIANFLMDNHPVLIYLEHATKEVSHDLVCFLTGVVYAIGGQIQPVSENTYMLSPGSMEITEEVIDSDTSDDSAAGGSDGYGYNGFSGFGGYNY